MAVTKIPFGAPGVASFQEDSFGQQEVRSGDTPVTTTTEKVGASTTLAIYSVVGRAANAAGGNLVLATATGSPAIKPVGILTAPVATGAGVTTTVDVYRSGMFNPDALVWDTSFNTDLLKFAAFEGSVSPDIFLQRPKHQDTFV
jgi:hypothetical protein